MSTTANKLKQKCHEYLWSRKYSRQGKAQVVCEETVAKKKSAYKSQGQGRSQGGAHHSKGWQTVVLSDSLFSLIRKARADKTTHLL